MRFGACVAVDSVSLQADDGEILAIVGENGAGKSTLMNVLFGLVRPTTGDLFVRGKSAAFRGPRDAIAAGIGMVHQHFRLVHTLTVAENVALGFEPRRGAWVDAREAERRVETLAAELGFSIDPHALVETLPVGAQQRVEILKSLARGAGVLILDEPTAVLTPQESDDLFRVVRALAAAGKTVLFISHKLGEVMAVSTRIAVMRAGALVAQFSTAATSAREVSRTMVGRDVITSLPRKPFAPGAAAMRLDRVSARGVPRLHEISLELHAGEILGIAGVEGNGQAELVEVVTGLRAPESGRVEILGRDCTRATPADVSAAGLGHVPGDRLRDAVVADLSVEDNLLLGRQREPRFRRGPAVAREAVHTYAVASLDGFDVRPRDPALPLRALSGGNQQKAVLARELSRRPKVLVAAHPTRGVDIGAVEQIHRRLLEERDRGTAILLVSADLGEILALSDRVAVMYGGRIVHVTDAAETDERALGAHMTGGT